MYAAGDSAGALPPFNLSCQVRRRCFYIFSELAVEVQLNGWGQLLNTAGARKPSWAFHTGLFVDLLTRFSRLSFVLRVLRVQEDALWVSSEPCSHAPAKLTAVPLFVTAIVAAFVSFFIFSSSKQQVCLFMELFYLQSGTRVSSSHLTCVVVPPGVWSALCVFVRQAAF